MLEIGKKLITETAHRALAARGGMAEIPIGARAVVVATGSMPPVFGGGRYSGKLVTRLGTETARVRYPDQDAEATWIAPLLYWLFDRESYDGPLLHACFPA